MHISKVTKGLIAGGLGLALLIGGGTFALWSDSQTVDAGTLNSGQLDVTVNGTSTWANINDPANPVPIDDITTYHIVPGDILQLNTSLTVTAIGDDLHADLSVDLSGLSSGDTDLLAIVKANSELSVASGGGHTPQKDPVADNTFDIDATTDSALAATLTITFPQDTADQVAQGESVDLGALKFTLDQVAS